MTLCDLLGEHGTQIPLVNGVTLEHIGYQCAGCAAIARLDGIFPPPRGLRCVTCGGPLPDVQHGVPGIRWENERGLSFCSRACWREPVKA
jgi:hypothetical protein